MRYIGIDYGTKRTGVAISDPSGIIAVVKETIPSTNQQALLDRIEAIVQEEDVDAVVVGFPLSLSGASSEMTHRVERFIDMLARQVEAPIFTSDERLTSMMAKNATKDYAGADIDQVAAQMMLQNYLDAQQ